MNEKRWTNRYIELASSKPHLLLSCRRNMLDDDEAETLRRKLGGYSEIYLDLGSGSGEHLLEYAARNPNALLLGIELRYKRAFRTAEKAEVAGLSNVYVVRADARSVIPIVADESLAGIFVNFPDPWDKRRWDKHRILKPQVLRDLARCLKPGGFFSYKTDHHGYFAQTVEELHRVEELRTISIQQTRTEAEPAGNIRTEFEKLFRSKGMEIRHLTAIKVGLSAANRV